MKANPPFSVLSSQTTPQLESEVMVRIVPRLRKLPDFDIAMIISEVHERGLDSAAELLTDAENTHRSTTPHDSAESLPMTMKAEIRESDLPPNAVKRLEELKELLAGLKPRELRVLDFVCIDGETNKAIANRLDVSERSVEQWRAAIVARLKVRTMLQAAMLYSEYRTLNLLNTKAVAAQ